MTPDAIHRLLATYPRTRPPLTPAHERIYVAEYRRNRRGGGVLLAAIHRLEDWMHRQIAKGSSEDTVLEVGAGSLNHLRFEPRARHYDCVEPFRELLQDAPESKRVRSLYADIRDVPEASRYDRILSIATLEHLEDLPGIVARAGLLLAEGGIFQAAIPTEGGLLWGLSWRMTTAVSYRLRTGLDYKSVMRHEHVNTAREIILVMRRLFAQVAISRFPSPFHHLSFYTYLEARRPRLDRCRAIVA
ncbi:MAG: methyltransferase domain-containing protein [Planctomycetota bacterium]